LFKKFFTHIRWSIASHKLKNSTLSFHLTVMWYDAFISISESSWRCFYYLIAFVSRSTLREFRKFDPIPGPSQPLSQSLYRLSYPARPPAQSYCPKVIGERIHNLTKCSIWYRGRDDGTSRSTQQRMCVCVFIYNYYYFKIKFYYLECVEGVACLWRLLGIEGYDIFRQINQTCVKRKLPSSDMHYALRSTLRHVNWMRWQKGCGDGYENVMHMARISLRVTRQTWRGWRMCLVIPLTTRIACMCVVRAAKEAALPLATTFHFPTACLPTVWKR